MKKDSRKFLSIIVRYLILVFVAIPGFDIFYFVFLPLTKYPVFYFLSLFYDAVLVSHVIFIGQKAIEIVGACVAGSAYYFLLILNLSTPNIKIHRRINMILLTFFSFLLINVIRIIVLSLMYLNNSPLFDVVHKIFWYLGSTVIVVLLWFISVRIFKIDGIPFYSDLKKIYSETKRK